MYREYENGETEDRTRIEIFARQCKIYTGTEHREFSNRENEEPFKQDAAVRSAVVEILFPSHVHGW